MAELSERTLEQWERNGFGPWVAVDKATRRWIGRMGLDELADWPCPHKVEVGWVLHRESGAGALPPRAAGLGCATASRRPGWSGSSASPWPLTPPPGRAMEKCGLRFQDELLMARTVVAWYVIDWADW